MTPVLPSNGIKGVIAIVDGVGDSRWLPNTSSRSTKNHIFNPAAIAVVPSLGLRWARMQAGGSAGIFPLLPFVLARRAFDRSQASTIRSRRFLLPPAALVMTSLTTHESAWWLPGWQTAAPLRRFSSSRFVMLTEPATTPPREQLFADHLRRAHRHSFCASGACRFDLLERLSSRFSLGNIFSVCRFSQTERLTLTLNRIEKTSASSDGFRIHSGSAADNSSRGSISNGRCRMRSPTRAAIAGTSLSRRRRRNKEIRLGVKFYEKSSSFKTAHSAPDANRAIA